MLCLRQKRLLENVFNTIAIVGLVVFLVQSVILLLLFAEKRLSSSHDLSLFQDSLMKDSVVLPKGFVLHQWIYLCEITTLRKLFQSSFFPKYPDRSEVTIGQSLHYYSPNKTVGARISGFLNVPESGFYTFQLKSIGTAEFWLKTDDSVGLQRIAKSKVIAQNSDKVYSIDLSNELFMDENQTYKFEIFNAGEFVQLNWILPGSNFFSDIKSEFISHDTSSFSHEVLTGLFPQKEFSFNNENRVGAYYFVSFIPKWVIDSAIRTCGHEFMNRKKGIGKVDDVNVVTLYDDLDGRKGDLWKQNNEVKTIVSLYMDGLEKIYPLKYRTKRLYKMEKLANTFSLGPLYKMQLEFKVDGLDYTQRVIQYVNQLNTTSICQPSRIQWQRDTAINIILVLKDRERAIKRFIDQCERAFEKALEVDLHIIIVQFGQSAIDIQSYMDETSLTKRYSVVKFGGPYSRSRGLNEGVSLAKGDNAIILAFDVNIDIPDTLFEDTRTSCIPGQVAFSPVFYQMVCPSDTSIPVSDYWCYQSYGILGIYKTDWEKLSGMELLESEQKENWNFIQKIQRSGMAVIRHTYPGLYRYNTPYKEYMKYIPKTSELVKLKDGFLERDDK